MPYHQTSTDVRIKPLFLLLASLLALLNTQAVNAAELSKSQAETHVESVFQKLAAERKPEMQWETTADAPRTRKGIIKAGGKEMQCVSIHYGNAEPGQRSLFISMHGGGQTAPRVNDQQWQNQIRLYRPKEGFYVAPRAPTNTWNLWHEKHIDQLFARLIENFVATQGVNPEKVYLMGYSAGGDGVYQLAPRMADRFAAATMMAGHPNGVSPDGLRNLPFRIYMGGKDSAYNRNKIAAQWKTKLEKLQQDQGGYEHKVTIYPESGHWMNRKDAEAVPWMAEQNRTSWPKQIIWGKSGTRSRRFYWLEGDVDTTVFGQVDNQHISIRGLKSKQITLRLNDKLVNLNQPVTVTVNNQQVWSGPVHRTQKSIQESLQNRLDPSMAATATLVIPLNTASNQ